MDNAIAAQRAAAPCDSRACAVPGVSINVHSADGFNMLNGNGGIALEVDRM